MSLNIFDETKEHLSKSNSSFMWAYLFIETLLRLTTYDSSSPSSPTSTKEEMNILADRLRELYADNEQALKTIDKFGREYSAEKAIWWYTNDSFLYALLNRSLRFQNLELLFLLRFFIADLFAQLEEISKEERRDFNGKTLPVYLVYRGQSMSSNEFEEIKDSVDKFVSVNTFLSTSLRKDVAAEFLKAGANLFPSHISVLFEIEVNPNLSTRPYANVTGHGCFDAESEVLFAPGTIFIIQGVRESQSESDYNVLKLELCDENNGKLRDVVCFWKDKIESETNQASLGWLVMQTGQWDQAKVFYETLLGRLSPSDPLVKDCYYGLGLIYHHLEQYDEAKACHEKALHTASPMGDNPTWFAKVYSALADTYQSVNRNSDALEFHSKALSVYSEGHGQAHREVAQCCINLGNVYRKTESLDKAVNAYQDALELYKRMDPQPNPLDLAELRTHLAQTYREQCSFEEASRNYQEALKIYQKELRSSVPRLSKNDPRLGRLYEDIGHVNRKEKKFVPALLSYHRAAEIYYHYYPQTDEHNKSIRKAIGYCNQKLR